MKNIILIHGAFHTGECWYRLVPVLEQRGFRVATPTLPGHRGNPRHPLLATLKGYANEVIHSAEQFQEPVTLLGHSLAGFAISVAAERRPELFSDLIYLTATIPKPGRSTLKDATPVGPHNAPRMKVRTTAKFPAGSAADFFYNTCAPDVQAKAASLLTPQPIRPMLGVVKTTPQGLGSVRKHYIECLQDRVNSIEAQHLKQKNMTFESVQTLDTDHSPFLSDPQALADAIARIANK